MELSFCGIFVSFNKVFGVKGALCILSFKPGPVHVVHQNVDSYWRKKGNFGRYIFCSVHVKQPPLKMNSRRHSFSQLSTSFRSAHSPIAVRFRVVLFLAARPDGQT